MESPQVTVERMLDSGAAFAHIEAYIERRADLRPEQRSALWLLAFSEADPENRREVVSSLLEDTPKIAEARRRYGHGRRAVAGPHRRR